MKHRLNYTRVRKPIHGFTLVELLVVISIIALLLSILIPSLQKARKQARIVVCKSNVRQQILGALTYSVDENDKLPAAPPWTASFIYQNALKEALYIQNKYITEPEVFWCPSGIPKYIRARGKAAYQNQLNNSNAGQYIYTAHREPFWADPVSHTQVGSSTGDAQCPTKSSQRGIWALVTDMVIGNYYSINDYWYAVHTKGKGLLYFGDDAHSTELADKSISGVNVGKLDGSVEFRKHKDIRHRLYQSFMGVTYWYYY